MTVDDLQPGTRFLPASKYDTSPQLHVARDKRLPAPASWPHPVKPNAETLDGVPALFSSGYPVAIEGR